MKKLFAIVAMTAAMSIPLIAQNKETSNVPKDKTNKMEEIWSKFEDWLSSNHEDGLNDLNPPITDGELGELEELQTILGVQLPKDLVDFLKVHNGGGGSLIYLEGESIPFEFSTSKGIRNNWDSCTLNLQNTIQDLEDGDRFLEDSVRVLIPFAHNGAGDLLCLDLDPQEPGIVVVWHEGPEVRDVGGSFESWFSEYVDGVLNGEIIMEEI